MKRTIKLNEHGDQLVIEAYTEEATLTFHGETYHGTMISTYKGCHIFECTSLFITHYFILELYQSTSRWTRSWFRTAAAARGAITRAITQGIIHPNKQRFV